VDIPTDHPVAVRKWYCGAMRRMASLIIFLLLYAATAEAQGNLSDVFNTIRTEGRSLTPGSRTRMFAILATYSTGERLAGEWQTLNDAITDRDPYVRDQACAALAGIMLVNQARRIPLPDTTRDLVIERFSERDKNLRENAIRIIALMAGGVPPTLTTELLRIARTDSESSVRGVAIGALASIPSPSPEINDFWLESLKDTGNSSRRGMVLNAFGFNTTTHSEVIALIIGALRDPNFYVRQEAIAAVVRIGKPAAAAIPLLQEIRDAPVSDQFGELLRSNAESAIRILSEPATDR